MVAAKLHSCVDAGDIRNAGVFNIDCFVDHRDQDPVDDKACSLIDLYRDLAQIFGDLVNLVNILCGSIDAGNNLDKLHHGSGIEEMHADDGLGKSCADLSNGKGGGIGSEDAVRVLDDLILQFLKCLLFKLHHFESCLNYEVRIHGDGVESAFKFGKDSILCSLLHFSLGNHLVKIAFDLIEAALRKFYFDIAEINFLYLVTLRKCLRNTGSHRTSADNCYFHGRILLFVKQMFQLL